MIHDWDNPVSGYVAMDLSGPLGTGLEAKVDEAEAKYVFGEAFRGERNRPEGMGKGKEKRTDLELTEL